MVSRPIRIYFPNKPRNNTFRHIGRQDREEYAFKAHVHLFILYQTRYISGPFPISERADFYFHEEISKWKSLNLKNTRHPRTIAVTKHEHRNQYRHDVPKYKPAEMLLKL